MLARIQATAALAAVVSSSVLAVGGDSVRVALLPLDSPHLAGDLVAFEPVSAAEGRAPAYLRAFAPMPHMIAPLAETARAILYEGGVAPETKIAMGLAIAQIHGAVYTETHMARLLAKAERGRLLQDAIEAGDYDALGDAERWALRHAEALTYNVKGLDDYGFGELRSHYNDSQIVELTMVACFFNYFNRVVLALDLQVEEWATLASPLSVQSLSRRRPHPARVALISDAEAIAVVNAAEQARDPQSMLGRLGVGLPYSLRAMMRAPEQASAWMGVFRAASADSTIGNEMKHWVSDAVSHLNRCDYCISHQVHKLMNVGVTAEEIAAVRTSDDRLDERQRLAVSFARALTNDPASVTDEMWRDLVNTFGERGAMEVLHETCAFNFMNRFTSGLRLPPEPEAMKSVEAVARAMEN